MRALIFAALSVFLAGSALAQPAAPTSEDVHRAFQETDRNGDGRIDREEFHRRTVEVFYFLDANRDGYLVVGEIAVIPIEAFRAADRDGDGKLSLQEYLNARFKDFEAMDANGDGVVTREELERYVRSHAPRR
ncbi:MAG TPA: EF-hand domain-containing protein [Solirubrobacteraceae bacterium]|jgi:Ca2+-binding EF-hand superfamily protein